MNSLFSSEFFLLKNKLKRGCKIILYGAGNFGQEIFHCFKKDKYCEIVLWVDRSFDNKRIMSPNHLLNMSQSEYDFIVLATVHGYYGEEMKWQLWDMGIKDKFIINCSLK